MCLMAHTHLNLVNENLFNVSEYLNQSNINYVERNSRAYKIYFTKAAHYQIKLNNKRPLYQRLPSEDITKKVYAMWTNVLFKLCEDIKTLKSADVKTCADWVRFMISRQVLVNFEKSIDILRFV